jgi:hypothetical protein
VGAVTVAERIEFLAAVRAAAAEGVREALRPTPRLAWSGLHEIGERPASVVYFIGCPACGLVKIGYTGNIVERFDAVRSIHWKNCDGDVLLLGFVEGGRAEERELHRRFARARQRGARLTEWFRFNEREFAWIRLLCWAGAQGRQYEEDEIEFVCAEADACSL